MPAKVRAYITTPAVILMFTQALALGQIARESAPARNGQIERTELFYPTGQKSSSILLIERIVPSEVRTGETFEYKLLLTNLTGATLRDVKLTEAYPPEFRVERTDPKVSEQRTGQLAWQWPKLNARSKVTMSIRGSATGVETLDHCAQVTLSVSDCASTRLVEPRLQLEKVAPAQVLICDPIPLRMVVRNAGNGTARGVRITDPLPDGWLTQDGKSMLEAEVGDLAAGQSREVTATVRATRTGSFTNSARASERGGLTAEGSSTTVVRQPRLVVEQEAPAYRYVGRPARFDITVTNTGDAPATRTTVVDRIVGEAELVSASHQGRYADGQITWNLGTIAPGAEETVTYTVRSAMRRTVRSDVRVTAACSEATASTTLEVRGIPAILLEVIDTEDPIEVGAQEVYEIKVVNQGSADGTNVRISCELPPEQEFVRTEGPSRATAQGQTVTFAPLPSLAPKATATFRVVVKGIAVGDVRMKVSLTSDQIKSPVEETESTHVY